MGLQVLQQGQAAPAATNLLQGLLASWAFDPTRGFFSDLTGKQHQLGLYTGAVVMRTADQFRYAAHFGLNTIAGQVSNSSSDFTLSTTDDFSVDLWIKLLAGYTDYNIPLNIGSSGPQKVYILINQSNGHLYKWDDFDSGYVVPTNQWVHIAYTFAHTGANVGNDTFYAQGASVGSRSATAMYAPAAAPIYLGGAGGSGGGEFLMRGVNFWKRCLAASEIKQLHNSGYGLTYPFSSQGSIQHRAALLPVSTVVLGYRPIGMSGGFPS